MNQPNKLPSHERQNTLNLDIILEFKALIEPTPQTEPRLAKAIRHVTSNPGSFIRCRMAWKVGSLSGLSFNSCTNIAIAVEYFHTASLIFDDLSCMDDADTRRGSNCVHILYGEATAMLTALAFINKAYQLIWAETASLSEASVLSVSGFVESCLGTSGILSGQSRDLAFGPEDNSSDKILQISSGKTVTLLRLALCLPALIADQRESTVQLLSRLSSARGLGYQIADDFKDVFLEENESGKTTDRDRSLCRPNLVVCDGVPAAAQKLATFVKEGDSIQDELEALDTQWDFLSQLRITVGPDLINKNGIPISGDL